METILNYLFYKSRLKPCMPMVSNSLRFDFKMKHKICQNLKSYGFVTYQVVIVLIALIKLEAYLKENKNKVKNRFM